MNSSGIISALARRRLEQEAPKVRNEGAEMAQKVGAIAPGALAGLGGLAGGVLGTMALPGIGTAIGAGTGASIGSALGGAAGGAAQMGLQAYADEEFDKERERQMQVMARKNALASLLMGG